MTLPYVNEMQMRLDIATSGAGGDPAFIDCIEWIVSG